MKTSSPHTSSASGRGIEVAYVRRFGLPVLLVLSGIWGCKSATIQRAPDPPLSPYKPGQSLSGSRMCDCTTCRTQRCCEASDSEAQQCDLNEVSESDDTLDFSSDGCAIAVDSCAGQCSKVMWRVPNDLPCARYAPEECCEFTGG